MKYEMVNVIKYNWTDIWNGLKYEIVNGVKFEMESNMN